MTDPLSAVAIAIVVFWSVLGACHYVMTRRGRRNVAAGAVLQRRLRRYVR